VPGWPFISHAAFVAAGSDDTMSMHVVRLIWLAWKCAIQDVAAMFAATPTEEKQSEARKTAIANP
jgi:hypothetical protein